MDIYEEDEEEYDDEYESECRAPCLGEHRETLYGCDDEYVLAELERAWTDSSHTEDTDWIRQDWSTFRAITLREARKRELDIPEELIDLITAMGVRM